MKHLPPRFGPFVIALLAIALPAWSQAPLLTADEMRQFLRSADVIAAEQTSVGITQPWRLTLTDGALTHDAAFQSVDIQNDVQRLGRRTEFNFVDSYRYNIAAYQLAELLGLGHMVPVTVERTWNDEIGAISWWIDDVMFDEATRVRERRRADDLAAWGRQMAQMLVFSALVQDTDRNKTNILYTNDWKLYMIDFTRAFRLWDYLQKPEDLVSIDRQVFERLQALSKTEVEQATDPHLTGGEVTGVIKRRDRIVDHFHRLIELRGEPTVLN